jgi:spermidine synthase
VETDVVDIDPAVVEMARRHFGLDEGLNVHVADARRFLLTTRERYDYIVLDVFNGDTTPAHLLSVEAMRLLRERLREGGVLAVNLIGDIGPRGTMTASVVKTMREVFARVEVRPTFEPAQAGTIGNLILLAHSGAPTHFESVDAAIAQVHPLARAGVYLGLTREVEPAAGDGIVLTDDFNPIDVDDLTVKEHVRQQILESTDWDILLGRLRQSQPLPG